MMITRDIIYVYAACLASLSYVVFFAWLVSIAKTVGFFYGVLITLVTLTSIIFFIVEKRGVIK